MENKCIIQRRSVAFGDNMDLFFQTQLSGL